jgi:Flp pilus assembly pilin Flp
MEILTKTYVKVRELQKRLSKGQTMTEYALILAAVAVVVFVTYEVMGQKINVLVNFIDSDLTAAAS